MNFAIDNIKRHYQVGSGRWNAAFLNQFILDFVEEDTVTASKKEKLTLLDIGCGYNSFVMHNHYVHKIGFDGWKPSLEIAKKFRTHDEFVRGTFEQIDDLFGRREFDIVIAIDFIEHLSMDDGGKLLRWIEEHTKLGAAIYTPNGFLQQPSLEEGDFQKHLSGWTVDDFRAAGYSCVGGAGLKFLRKEFHEIRFKPRFVWAGISHLSQVSLTSWCPRLSAALWATKVFHGKG